MNLENVMELLAQFGWEYQINYAQKILTSTHYNRIASQEFSANIFTDNDKFYKKKIKKVIINGQECTIEYLEDITPFINYVLYLKKDKVTGLATRADLDDYISHINFPCVIVICDIDDFKKINDQYGHPFGDKILRSLGEIILQHTRKQDFAGRYGGEEFLIVFNTIDIASIKAKMDMINQQFNKTSGELNITFSSGIALHTIDKSIKNTIYEADMALYYVKNNGKNNSAIYNLMMENSIKEHR